jgi:hypothetical protein
MAKLLWLSGLLPGSHSPSAHGDRRALDYRVITRFEVCRVNHRVAEPTHPSKQPTRLAKRQRKDLARAVTFRTCFFLSNRLDIRNE